MNGDLITGIIAGTITTWLIALTLLTRPRHHHGHDRPTTPKEWQ